MTATIHATALHLADSDPGRVGEVECRDVARAYLEAEAKLAEIKLLCDRYGAPTERDVRTRDLAQVVLRIVEERP